VAELKGWQSRPMTITLDFRALDVKNVNSWWAIRGVLERHVGIFFVQKMQLFGMRRSIIALAILTGFGSPASAWELAPLARCFEAMERGSIVHSFSRDDWHNSLTQQFHFQTEHVWVFYDTEFFDLYYDKGGMGAAAAYCEVKRLYPGEGQPD
jgi:hypothetical protein